jgi:hypothetical protein
MAQHQPSNYIVLLGLRELLKQNVPPTDPVEWKAHFDSVQHPIPDLLPFLLCESVRQDQAAEIFQWYPAYLKLITPENPIILPFSETVNNTLLIKLAQQGHISIHAPTFGNDKSSWFLATCLPQDYPSISNIRQLLALGVLPSSGAEIEKIVWNFRMNDPQTYISLPENYVWLFEKMIQLVDSVILASVRVSIVNRALQRNIGQFMSR